MRNFIDIVEARRNPEINTINKTNGGIDRLMDWTTKGEGYFVSFTKLEKVGLNPKSMYFTPLGIYAYPLWDAEFATQVKNNEVPFAGGLKYANVIQADMTNIVCVQDNDFDDLTAKTTKWLADRLPIYRDLSGPEHNSRMSAEMLMKFLDKVLRYAKDIAYTKTPGGIWWSYTRLAALLVRYVNEPDNKANIYKVKDLEPLCYSANSLAKQIEGGASMWTRVMLDIGVKGVVDLGGQIIHANEPTQAVFFSTEMIHVVDRITNPRKIPDLEIKTPRQFSWLLSKLSTSDNMTVARSIITGILSTTISGGRNTSSLWVKGDNDGRKQINVIFEPTAPPKEYFELFAKFALKLEPNQKKQASNIIANYIEDDYMKGVKEHIQIYIDFIRTVSPDNYIEIIEDNMMESYFYTFKSEFNL